MVMNEQGKQSHEDLREECVMRMHRYAVGQHVSYTDNSSPNDFWMGGYEIIFLLPAGNREPQYQIRSVDQSYDRVVGESQLQEDLGARGRCG